MKLPSPFGRWMMALVVLVAGCTLNNVPSANIAVSGSPTVRILLPQPNATYFEGVAVNIQAAVSNAGTDIDRVEIVVDGTTVATITAPNAAGAETFTVTHGWSAASVGAHTIGVTAFRADGSSSSPASVEINVIESNGQTGGQSGAQTGAPTVTRAATSAGAASAGAAQSQPTTAASVAPTGAVAATATSQPATPTQPTASFKQGINVRRGPGLEFNPPIGTFAAGQSTEIIAVNPAGTWFKVRFGGGEGWVFAALIDASGDIASLPRDPGPPVPTPVPVQPTAVPQATQPPAVQTSADLVAGIVEFNPAQPTCAQTFNIGLDVANLGSQPTSTSGTVSVQDVRASDGSTQQTTIGGFPVLQSQQTFRVDMPLTVSTWYNEEHTIILIIDPDGQIPETDKGNNRREVRYTLQRGSCP